MEKTELFNLITQQFPVQLGQDESRKYRDRHDITLTYGQIQYQPFAQLLNSLTPVTRGIFYDLGSGTGKAVLAAALQDKFSVCRGIQKLEGLFNLSLQLKTKYEQFNLNTYLEFFHSDFLQFDWSDADVFFCNATCYNTSIMNSIGSVPVKSGTIAITTSRPLEVPQWKILECTQKDMSWGFATVYIQVRI